jgi:RNA polymerase sigma-70 factor (sigma-E family)
VSLLTRRADREAAYVDYVASRQAHLRRIAYALCGDWAKAEDLLQTALVKLYVAWPRVALDGKEDAYVRRILVRANIDESRRPWRREVAGELPESAAPAGLPSEDRTVLFEALQSLPPMQRKAVVLRHWLGLSVAEAAAELGVAEGTVKSNTSRGLEAMRAALAAAER